MKSFTLFALVFAAVGLAHDHHHEDQIPMNYVKYPYQATYPGDDEVTADSIFSGITTFAKLPWVQCLGKDRDTTFDIAFIGAPFDTGTSYRPGARFGPAGIRAGSRRLTLYGGYNVPLEVNPFLSGLKIVDCGDIPVTPYDNKFAIQQIEGGHKELLHRPAFSPLGNDALTGKPLVPISLDGKHHPRVVTLGGDHTIVLPLLRSIHSAYGPISVIHFDSHLDTWKPSVFGGAPSDQAAINHGTYFYWASQEGLIKNGSSIASILLPYLPLFLSPPHGAIRTTLSGPADYANDDASGFQRIEAREIDTIGTDGIIKKIRETVGDRPVYLSIDIDSIDPAFAPATGTPETGGWSTRELRTILRGLDGLHIVSADIVEVAPAYDTNAELTTMAAADVLFEVISVMAKTPLGKVAN
ncbi:arginase family-domain-containing protein [Suillus clintonianus]|uniref:arginase family-domain-containing protein n=1 Tax=Suillus clintonianus TaxID=1904413 RepID=UPI001B866EF0|nr:arginase family-domain-containing protein [Suillus clintonianus]KAG2144322.1 arginase family-domain-containing protein [Suillus clintonianus]